VAETFLRRWFGRAPAPAADEARAEIDRLLPDRPTTRGPLLWLRAVLDELVPEPGYITAPMPEAAACRAKLREGTPALWGLRITVDPTGFSRRWEKLGEAMPASEPGGGLRTPGRFTRRRKDVPDWLLMVMMYPERDPEREFREIGELVGCEPPTLITLGRFAFFAGMSALAEPLAPVLSGLAWERGICPVCGSPPVLAEFRGLDQSRFLRCGLCAASWEAARQWCPACGTRDHDALGFLARDGEENRYRVATCDACKTGIKTLSTLSTLPPLMLLVADAATLHLDLAAADRGYTGP
jgi:FdhE protein